MNGDLLLLDLLEQLDGRTARELIIKVCLTLACELLKREGPGRPRFACRRVDACVEPAFDRDGSVGAHQLAFCEKAAWEGKGEARKERGREIKGQLTGFLLQEDAARPEDSPERKVESDGVDPRGGEADVDDVEGFVGAEEGEEDRRTGQRRDGAKAGQRVSAQGQPVLKIGDLERDVGRRVTGW